MATSWSQFWAEKVDEISENSESESEIETSSTDYSSDSDNVTGETSSRRTSSPLYGGSWKPRDFSHKQTNISFY
jgi:hypothetical protein